MIGLVQPSSVGFTSKQAFEKMVRDGLPPTPRNYAVYYNYFLQNDKELCAEYDAVFSSGKMTQGKCDELYESYLAPKDLSFLQDVNSVIDRELKKVLDMLNASTRETDQFGVSLSDFTGKLSGASSVEALRDAVGKIVDETRHIAAQNQKLRQDLEKTTAQLSEVRSDFDRVHRESQTDPLTEVGNRKFLDQELPRVMGEMREQNSVMSILMADIDHFKQFNDVHGHLVGDQVLRLVAKTLVENLKGRDVIARYGGEEFVIILPYTKLQDAERVANLLRQNLASKQVTRRGTKEVIGTATISIGAAEYLYGETGETLIGRADTALYKAKQTGRNKVVCAEGDRFFSS